MSPRTRDQIDEIRKQSRTSIQSAALKLFAKQGFHNTSISEIAREASVSKGLIYNYFDSKEALLKSIIESAMDVGNQLIGRHLDPSQDPMQSLAEMLDEAFDMVEANPKYWKLMMSLSFHQDVMARFKDEIDQQQIKNIGLITRLLERANVEEPEKEAMLIAAISDGILLHFIHIGPKYPLSEMRAYIKERMGMNRI